MPFCDYKLARVVESSDGFVAVVRVYEGDNVIEKDEKGNDVQVYRRSRRVQSMTVSAETFFGLHRAAALQTKGASVHPIIDAQAPQLDAAITEAEMMADAKQ